MDKYKVLVPRDLKVGMRLSRLSAALEPISDEILRIEPMSREGRVVGYRVYTDSTSPECSQMFVRSRQQVEVLA
jgi:hypothetical protein